jgi:predicted component of type VI protein secretion system
MHYKILEGQITQADVFLTANHSEKLNLSSTISYSLRSKLSLLLINNSFPNSIHLSPNEKLSYLISVEQINYFHSGGV